MGAKGVNIGVEEQVVAAADVDKQHAAKSVQKIKAAAPDAKFYRITGSFSTSRNSRRRVGGDAGPPSLPGNGAGPGAGLNVYCEKPLCHDVYEARKLRELAKAKKVVTQMGHQGHPASPSGC
jgi:hypothetical protein